MGGGFMNGGGGILMIFLFILLVAGAVWVFVSIYQKNQKTQYEETPLDALKKRYAKGEISSQEYQKIKSELEK
ncbi:MAG: hypothetical protein A2Y41_06125 [Spirochaetes bacterium GWB1_36_13]|nr:MAG: hypothetical protein A2Y41_06125 [Spirochaetes bacterium GWB1_36_13]